MNVTRVKVDIQDKAVLKAYCDVEIDDQLVIRQVKVLELEGRLKICFPAKMRQTPCPDCGKAVKITDPWCGWCGVEQDGQQERIDGLRAHLGLRDEDRLSFYVDMVHPINREARQIIERAVFDAYERAKEEQQ